jgi:hydrogenase maturation factor
MRVLEAGQNGLCVCVEDDGGARAEVMTDLVGAVVCGDKVLVHAGVAIARLA